MGVNNEAEVQKSSQSSKFLMLNKKERILLRALLSGSLASEAGREFIAKKFGEEYLEVGDRLLSEMGGEGGIP